jgi:hypothetical protein
MNEDDFYLKVAYALSGCQLVEEQLKLYVTEALWLVKKRIGHRIPFRFGGDDYADSSLERLIDAFRKLSDNDALVAELRRFKDERNYLSHKGIAQCLDYEGDLSESAALEFQNRLDAIQAEAQRLRNALHEEANHFRVYLWFEDGETGSGLA